MEDKKVVSEYSTAITIKDPALEPYYIIKDSYCFTVHQNSMSNPNYTDDGVSKSYIKTLGHYVTLGAALKSITVEKMHFKKEYNSIKEFIKEYEQVQTTINKILDIC